MKKRIFALLFAAALLIMTTVAVSAVYDGNYIIDEFGVLNEEEISALNAMADNVYQTTGFNVCMLLTENTNGDTIYGYIEQRYATIAGEENGVILGIDYDNDERGIFVSGEAESVLSDEMQTELFNAFNADETWYGGVQAYISCAEKYFAGENTAQGGEYAQGQRLADFAGLLSEEEKGNLLQKLDEISERQGCDIVVVTISGLDNRSAMEYADDYYDYGGYRSDGALLLLSMAERDWYVSTVGYCITAITNAGLDYMSGQFVGELSKGNYYSAFCKYADLCDEFITKARDGEPYDVGNIPKVHKPLDSVWVAYALAFGVVVALCVLGYLKSQLNSVSFQTAANYVRQGSMKVTSAKEIFLYSHISRTERQDNSSRGGSSTHSSSSGTTHGGGGGKF